VRWIKISIFNFTLLALLGSILRYKIAFSLPFIDQKHLLHAHSHFAFAGWVSQILMCLFLYALKKDTIEWENKIKKFEKIFFLNLITAYGMLISFAIQGYALYSIIFSTASIFVSYWFAASVLPLIKESNIHPITKKYFYASLLFNVLSSIGPFSLAFMMVSHMANQDYLLGAVFYYLHFQYNGWFLFVIFGTLNEQIAQHTDNFDFKRNFNVLLIAAIMTLFLSIPWIDKQNMLGIVIFAIVIMQFFVFISFLRNTTEGNGPPLLLIDKIKIPLKRIVTFAILIKGILQVLILVPSLDQYAFGLRPVIIAYLHLVLIGVVSFYIFHYLIKERILLMSKNLNKGLLIFLFGFILNEIVLVLQGLSWLNIVGLPLTNETLFLAAILMFVGLIVVTTSILKKDKNREVEVAEIDLS
jgi:hypothetical protein